MEKRIIHTLVLTQELAPCYTNAPDYVFVISFEYFCRVLILKYQYICDNPCKNVGNELHASLV